MPDFLPEQHEEGLNLAHQFVGMCEVSGPDWSHFRDTTFRGLAL